WLLNKNTHITQRGFWFAAAAGAVAAGAFVAYVISSQSGQISVASTLRGLSFLVTTLIAVSLLGERLEPRQWVGIIAAGAGLLLLVK
ncbi:MAG: EamA family transporter, partial [Parcubacteria group bacterium]